MPRRPRKPCSVIGCSELVEMGTYRCSDCETNYMRERGMTSGSVEDRSMYHTSRWLKLRERVIKEEPFCRRCKAADSTTCDHILAVRLGGDAWKRSNLQGLCTPCHNIKRGEESKIYKQLSSRNK